VCAFALALNTRLTMPQFQVRLLVQCAEPNVTPDVANAAVTMPRRMLWEIPRELAPLIAANGVRTIDGGGTDRELALQAARQLVGADGPFEVLPDGFTHREVAGSYLQSQGDSTVFLLSRRGTGRPWTTRQTITVAKVDTGETVAVPVEFRCHVVVQNLGLAKVAATDSMG
jgi:hypothetical protein